MTGRPNPAEHIKLARWAVNRWLRRRPWFEHLRDDLVAAAVAELCEAVRHYDPERGAWSSLAVVAAEHAILHEIRRIGGPVRTPNGKRPSRSVSVDEDHGPGTDAVAVHELRGSSRDAHINAAQTLLEVLADDAPTPEQEAASAEAPRLLGALGDTERMILARRAGGETLAEIGEDMGCSRQYVQQVEARALRRLAERVGA